jgi:hypothetical protein
MAMLGTPPGSRNDHVYARISHFGIPPTHENEHISLDQNLQVYVSKIRL